MKYDDPILKKKTLAFSFVAVAALGTVIKEQWAIEGGPLLDGVLIASLCVGVILWIGSKRMERRSRSEEKGE